MSVIEPTRAAKTLFTRGDEPSPITDLRRVSLVAKMAVAELMLTNVHHVYGARRYGTPWRLHVLLLTIPAILSILGARRRLLHSATDSLARWALMWVTLVVPVLGIGAFEGFYNHLLKDALFFLGAGKELMTRWFPAPMYEMPGDAFFEITGVAQAFLGTLVAVSLYHVASHDQPDTHGASAPRGVVSERLLTTITKEQLSIPDRSKIVHLQFRRFAGCPICNLHVRSFVRRQHELSASQVLEVLVFHSSAEELRIHASDLPFAVVPDLSKALYAEFGVESSPRSVFNPRAWPAILLGSIRSLLALRRTRALPPLRPHGGSFGLPADFLIAPDGRILAAKYGQHADDQWSVDEVLQLARPFVGKQTSC